MSRASTITKLPLDRWAQLMGINPLHFAGVQIPQTNEPGVSGTGWFQWEWQDNDAVSREEVAAAIRSAEDDIEDFLGFRLLPAWEEDEWAPTVRPFHPETINFNDRDIRARGQQVDIAWGWLLSGGVRVSTLVVAGTAIVYSSTGEPSSYKDTATITFATTVTEASELHVYYPGHAGEEEWEIRPIEVAISGGIATITWRRELGLNESFMDSLDIGSEGLRAAQGTEDANFLTGADVYRVHNDPQQQVNLMWEPDGSCVCGDTTCPACSYGTQTGCLHFRGTRRNPRIIYTPAQWDATTESFTAQAYAVLRQPDATRLWYRAGWQLQSLALPTITMDPRYARAVALCAAARLKRKPKGNSVQAAAAMVDLSFETGVDEFSRHRLARRDLENPLGTRRGEVQAWRLISRNSRRETAPRGGGLALA